MAGFDKVIVTSAECGIDFSPVRICSHQGRPCLVFTHEMQQHFLGIKKLMPAAVKGSVRSQRIHEALLAIDLACLKVSIDNPFKIRCGEANHPSDAKTVPCMDKKLQGSI